MSDGIEVQVRLNKDVNWSEKASFEKQKEKDNDDALRLLREQHAQREKDWAQQLEKAKMDQAGSRRPAALRRRHAIDARRL